MVTARVEELEYLSSPLLNTPHGFSTRLGGVSEGYLASLNLGCHRGDREENLRENYRRFGAATGVDTGRLVMANQVHGDTVRVVDGRDVKPDLLVPTPFEADGLATAVPGIALVVFSADCIPILFHDPVGRAVAACHAGWRGTAAAIAVRTVETLETALGCRREDIRAAVGPGIGGCCFETDGDVPQAMVDRLGDLARPHIRRRGGKYQVELKAINRDLLLAAGVRPEHLEVSEECTCCHPERYWSHRYTHGVRGSQAAAIQLEVRP